MERTLLLDNKDYNRKEKENYCEKALTAGKVNEKDIIKFLNSFRRSASTLFADGKTIFPVLKDDEEKGMYIDFEGTYSSVTLSGVGGNSIRELNVAERNGQVSKEYVKAALIYKAVMEWFKFLSKDEKRVIFYSYIDVEPKKKIINDLKGLFGGGKKQVTDFEGLSEREIADRFGIAKSTVGYIKKRAIKKIIDMQE